MLASNQTKKENPQDEKNNTTSPDHDNDGLRPPAECLRQQ
jgi:hypothetical protein